MSFYYYHYHYHCYSLREQPIIATEKDFVINRFFMKLFNTNIMDTVKFYQDQFGFELPSVLIVKRRDKFLARYNSSN